MYIYW